MKIKDSDRKHLGMERDYDVVTDTLFFFQVADYDYKKSVRMSKNVILDLDKNDEPVAFEILHASKYFGLKSKFPLTQHVKLDLDIDIDEKSIVMEGRFIFLTRHMKEPKTVKAVADNLLNLPSQDMHLATA